MSALAIQSLRGFMLAMLILGFVPAQDLTIGSKNFAENRILAEIVKQLIEAKTDLSVAHTQNLAGTKVCWDALLAGELDFYVEYTGTAWAVILKEPKVSSNPLKTFLHVRHRSLREFDVEWLEPFGLNNTYAMAVRRELSEKLGLKRISDLIEKGDNLKAGFSTEFMNREDGWPGLKAHYAGLNLDARGLEHGLVYEALAQGQLDVVDAYSTDGKLRRYDVVTLEDDLGFFPPYNAALLVRSQVFKAHPELREILYQLAFSIDDATAIDLNYRVEVQGESFESVAAGFLARAGLVKGSGLIDTSAVPRDERGPFYRLWKDRERLLGLLLEHLGLVLISVLIATLISIPLGIWITKHRKLRGLFLGGASVVQTIPSLALLAILIAVPTLGLGIASAVVALILYAVLPILRNTCTGLDSVDPVLVDAAKGLGLTPRQVLVRIQFPMARRTIIAGLRTAVVISVGVATLAAFIGAGGLGQPIIEGLSLNDNSLVLSGAIPTAALALALDGLLALAERWFTPRGMRLQVAD